MPIYEYQCESCGHEFEVMQKFSDALVQECQLCHGEVRKLISQSTFHLKGTGWYATDYAKKSNCNGGNGNHSKDTGKEKESEKCAATSSSPNCSNCPSSSAKEE